MPHNLPARPRTPPESDTTGTAVTATAPRMILNRYELLEPLGAGGMGQVFVARDRSLRRDVAIKVLAANLAARPGFSQQLLREARAVAQLHHPHIATVYDVVDDGGSVCIVMEYLRGETLASRLRRGPLSTAEAIRRGCGDRASPEPRARARNRALRSEAREHFPDGRRHQGPGFRPRAFSRRNARGLLRHRRFFSVDCTRGWHPRLHGPGAEARVAARSSCGHL